MAKGLIKRFLERSCVHTEDSRPVNDFEDIGRNQCLELGNCEGRFLIKDRIGSKDSPKEAVRDSLDMRPCSGSPLYGADEVNIVDALHSGNVVSAGDLPFDRGQNHIAEIACEQRLAQVLSGTRYGEDRHLLHKPRQPAEMFPVKPAEHKGWSQDHLLDSACHHQRFLGFLGLGINILHHGVHNRRGDVDNVSNVVAQRCFHDSLSRLDIVAGELREVGTTDLGVRDDERMATGELHTPVVGADVISRQIFLQDAGRWIVSL